ncbi:MAG: GNAT family protein [Chlamydiota bacterium]|nr:GNAT family protein [Chlamydiota bacterium]
MAEEKEDKNLRSPLNVDIRYTEATDAEHLKRWLMDPEVNRWFPMADEVEIDDAVNRWIGFYRYRCSLTAVYQGTPVALTTLYLQPYKKLAHQCEFGIIVAPEFRGQKIGSEILNNLIFLAKDKFKVELLHLQVYEGNPAIRLYERMGFKEFGRQTHWIKEENGEFTGRLFMERFI